MKIIFCLGVGVWLVATVFAALALARSADDLVEHLRRKENRRRHTLGKWLVRSQQLRRMR